MRRRAAVLALALASVPGWAIAETPRTETRAYATGFGTVTVCRATEGSDVPVGVGGACFALDGTEDSVSLTISDLSGPPVQGYYQFLSRDGSVLGEGVFCDAGQAQVISGAHMLRIYVDGLIDGLLVDGCGVGTAGTVTAVFS